MTSFGLIEKKYEAVSYLLSCKRNYGAFVNFTFVKYESKCQGKKALWFVTGWKLKIPAIVPNNFKQKTMSNGIYQLE